MNEKELNQKRKHDENKPLTEDELYSDDMYGKPVYCVEKHSGRGEWFLLSGEYLWDNRGGGEHIFDKLQYCDIYLRPPKE